MNNRIGILFNTNPLVVNVELASILGLNESIVLQQIHYWLEINRKEGRNLRDGCHWTYNSYTDWQEQFPFWSESTIKRTIGKLENEGVLVSAGYNRDKFDRTKWYRIDYEKLNILMSARSGQNDPIDNIGISDGSEAVNQETEICEEVICEKNAYEARNIRIG